MSDKPAEEPDHDDHPLRRVSLRSFERVIDQQVRQAEEAGLMRDLPGAGKPLRLDDDTNVPDELRLGFRMLKQAGYAPPWIELQKSIREELAALELWIDRTNARWGQLGEMEREKLRAEHAQKLRGLNKQIGAYNLSAPPVAGQLPLLQPWRELRKLGQ